MQEAKRTYMEITYIGIRKETMVQWVALRPLFGVCEIEKGYGGGGCRREDLWQQEATEKQLWATLEGIYWEDKRRGRFGESVTH